MNAMGQTGAFRIAAAVGWVFVVALWPNPLWPWQGLSALGVVVLAVAMRIPWRRLLGRVGVMLPFVVLIAVGQLGQPDWPLRVGNLMLKAGLSLGIMVVLVASLPRPALLGGLRRLGAPVLVVELLGFWERYLRVLQGEWDRMRLARMARTFRPSRRREFTLAAQSLGLLLVRSYERAERVHQAMRARGYRGSR